MGKVARFLEADLKRAVSAVSKAGVRDARVEIAIDGTISIVWGASAQTGRGNSCDDILDKR